MTEETPPKKFLASATSIVNQYGLQIDALEPLSGYTEEDRPEGMHRFVGHFVVPIDTPQGKMGHPIQFPIKAESIEEAFENFEESLKAHMEEQQRGPRIAVPTSQQTSQIIQP